MLMYEMSIDDSPYNNYFNLTTHHDNGDYYVVKSDFQYFNDNFDFIGFM